MNILRQQVLPENLDVGPKTVPVPGLLLHPVPFARQVGHLLFQKPDVILRKVTYADRYVDRYYEIMNIRECFIKKTKTIA